MPKVKEGKIQYSGNELENYITNFSSKLSDIVRQLAIAGIAIDWIFLFNSKSEEYNYKWLIPLLFFLVAIAVDAYYYQERIKVYEKEIKKDSTDDIYPISEKEEEQRNKIQDKRNWWTIFGYLILFAMIGFEIFSPQKVILDGTIYDAKTQLPISATFTLTEDGIPTGEETLFQTDSLGKFKASLKNNRNYQYKIIAAGYFILSGKISLDSVMGLGKKKLFRDYYLTPIKIDSQQILKGIFFDFDSTTLRAESMLELDKVVFMLKENSNLIAKISAHTDDQGSDDFNMGLSLERAREACNYLQRNGIDSSRLIPVGYGETKPIALNNTEENCQLNRRVEIQYLLPK